MGEITVNKEGHVLQGTRYLFLCGNETVLYTIPCTILKIFHLSLQSHSPPFPTLLSAPGDVSLQICMGPFFGFKLDLANKRNGEETMGVSEPGVYIPQLPPCGVKES